MLSSGPGFEMFSVPLPLVEAVVLERSSPSMWEPLVAILE